MNDKVTDPFNYKFAGHDGGCPRCQGFYVSDYSKSETILYRIKLREILNAIPDVLKREGLYEGIKELF